MLDKVVSNIPQAKIPNNATVSIVTTTIHEPNFLLAYADNIAQYDHSKVNFIVIGDRKTPDTAFGICSDVKNCCFIDLETQENYLQKFSKLRKHLPINSISRRNVGNLFAYENGADIIIMIDDDNLATDYDCVGDHSIVGTTLDLSSYESSNGWFNVCSALNEVNNVAFYPRGYPPSRRWVDSRIDVSVNSCRVAVNAGLWLNDPDIDALTRIERRLTTSGMKENWPNTFALTPGTWSPWNCQNTAISRAAVPSYFLSPHTGRHLDIWASYITTAIAEAQDEVVTFGVPLAFHDRNAHNLYEDLEAELPWMRMTDEFCDALRVISIPSTGYLDGLKAVIEGLDEEWDTDQPVKKGYLEGLRIWHTIFKSL